MTKSIKLTGPIHVMVGTSLQHALVGAGLPVQQLSVKLQGWRVEETVNTLQVHGGDLLSESEVNALIEETDLKVTIVRPRSPEEAEAVIFSRERWSQLFSNAQPEWEDA